MNIFFAIIFPLFFLILGMWFFANGLLFIFLGLASNKWPTVNGSVNESKVKEGTTGLGYKAYWPEIKYEYQIGSKIFHGERVAFGKYGTKWNNTHKRDIAQSITARYAVGRSILVHYSPIIKNVSVLETGFSWGSVAILFFGTLWLFFGLDLLFFKKIFS